MILIRCKLYRASPESIQRRKNNPGKGATNSTLTLSSYTIRTPISRTLYWTPRSRSHRSPATPTATRYTIYSPLRSFRSLETQLLLLPKLPSKLNYTYVRLMWTFDQNNSWLCIWLCIYLHRYHPWQRRHRSPRLPILGLTNLRPWKLHQQRPETIVVLSQRRLRLLSIFNQLPFCKLSDEEFSVIIHIIFIERCACSVCTSVTNLSCYLETEECVWRSREILYLRKFGPDWKRSNRRKQWRGQGTCKLQPKYE